jgi:hypothetical protein
MVIEVGVSGSAPVLVSVTGWALLGVPKAWPGNVSVAGVAVAVVRLWPADHSAVCHTPRPYVPAVSTCADAEAGEALSSTTGASGNPVPNADQHDDPALAQLATWVVK